MRELTPLALVLTMAAALVFLALTPALPQIEAANQAPRQTGENYPETNLTNPQITLIQSPTSQTSTPDTDTQKAEAGLANAAVLAAFAVLGGTGTYILLKHGNRAKHVLSLALSSATLASTAFFVDKALMQVAASILSDTISGTPMRVALSLPPAIFVLLATGLEARQRIRKAALALFSLLSGALVATLLPIYAIFPLVLLMAAYDLYSVRSGPIGKTGHESLSLMSACGSDEWSLGFGDLTFYTLLPSASLAYAAIYVSRYAFYDSTPLVGVFAPWLVFALVASAILVGLQKSLKGSEGLSPGLPLPILLGCGALVACVLVFQLVNYMGWGWLVPIF